METFTFNTVELILLSAAGILFIIQLIYYFGLYNRIHVHNTVSYTHLDVYKRQSLNNSNAWGIGVAIIGHPQLNA